MVEGYSQDGLVAEQYLVSRARAALVRDYLIGRFHLDPDAVGLMPLGRKAIAESPAGDSGTELPSPRSWRSDTRPHSALSTSTGSMTAARRAGM